MAPPPPPFSAVHCPPVAAAAARTTCGTARCGSGRQATHERGADGGVAVGAHERVEQGVDGERLRRVAEVGVEVGPEPLVERLQQVRGAAQLAVQHGVRVAARVGGDVAVEDVGEQQRRGAAPCSAASAESGLAEAKPAAYLLSPCRPGGGALDPWVWITLVSEREISREVHGQPITLNLEKGVGLVRGKMGASRIRSTSRGVSGLVDQLKAGLQKPFGRQPWPAYRPSPGAVIRALRVGVILDSRSGGSQG